MGKKKKQKNKQMAEFLRVAAQLHKRQELIEAVGDDIFLRVISAALNSSEIQAYVEACMPPIPPGMAIDPREWITAGNPFHGTLYPVMEYVKSWANTHALEIVGGILKDNQSVATAQRVIAVYMDTPEWLTVASMAIVLVAPIDDKIKEQLGLKRFAPGVDYD